MFAIEVQALVRLFGKKMRAVDGLSFQVKQGEIFGLLGPNGAGKSTTVRILTTILRPTSGIARVMGFDVMSDPLSVRRHIAVVLQETAVETMLSVEDNFKIYAQLHGITGAEAGRRIGAVLERFGLVEKLKEKAQDLSIGLRRRLQVARAFLVDSPVLFLDEATTGMDPIIKRETLNAIRQMAQNGRTILLTTQLLEEAETLCDRIIIMNEGRSVAEGTMEDLRGLIHRRFHVSITFGEATAEIAGALRKLRPLQMNENGPSFEMTFEGEETALLGHLAELSQRWRVERLEIRGAGLEDIFVTLLKPEGVT